MDNDSAESDAGDGGAGAEAWAVVTEQAARQAAALRGEEDYSGV